MPRLSTSSLIPSQVPDFVRSEYPTFVAFVEAYYEYLDTQGIDLKTLKDLDITLDTFIGYFKKELAHNLPKDLSVDEKFVLQHIKDEYLAKGSEASFKLLFKLLYDETISLKYPATQMLRASDGRWRQDRSIFIKITTGTPDLVENKRVTVVQDRGSFNIQLLRQEVIEINVDGVIQNSDDTYEFFTDGNFNQLFVGDSITYSDTFVGEIVSTTSSVQIVDGGSGFTAGQLFELKPNLSIKSIVKITRVDSTGVILAAEFVKFGIDYITNFSIQINPQSDLLHPDIAGPTSFLIGSGTIALTDSLSGNSEQGIINNWNYNYFDVIDDFITAWTASTVLSLNDEVQTSNRLYRVSTAGTTHASTAPTHTSGSASNGSVTLLYLGVYTSNYVDETYAGEILSQFSSNVNAGYTSFADNATLTITLGPEAKYPGYYYSNSGFISDAIFIQDSLYYQAFSYVINSTKKLEIYKNAVKNMLHPIGMKLFSEFEISNEFDISIELESMVQVLLLSLQDTATATDLKTFVFSKLVEGTNQATVTDLYASSFGKFLTETTSVTTDGYLALNPYSSGGYFAITPIIYDNTVDVVFATE